MGFARYMNSNFPDWKKTLNLDEITEIKRKYDKVESWNNTIKTIINNERNHNLTNIDYSTDYDKAQINLIRAQGDLEAAINRAKRNYNVSVEEKQTTFKN